MTSTKLAFLTEAADQYAPYEGAGSYDDLIKTKMENLIRESYPWLGDFILEMVDSDQDKSYACAAGKLRGFSSGYAVEFPVFYLDGDILDIPTFVLPERKLMLPFDEAFYKVITTTLNNSDDQGLVRERDDISDALLHVLADSDYHNVSEVIKMGSFARIASFIPRRVLKSYAKTACGQCPELIRDFYAAIKLSKARSNVKTASANLKNPKLNFKEEHIIPFRSIVSPVFETEAEAKERYSGGMHTNVVKICEEVFVLPEANNKLNLTEVPTAWSLAKSLGQDFEYLTPGEWADYAWTQLTTRGFEPFVSICPSSTRDYWVAPIMEIEEGSQSAHICDCCRMSEYEDEDFRKAYDLARNNLGGEYGTYERAGRKPFNTRTSEFFERSMVFYFPKAGEKRRYFEDILDHPLTIDHDLDKLILGGCRYIPMRSGDFKVAMLSLNCCRSYELAEANGGTKPNKKIITKSDGTGVVNYMNRDNEVCVKVVFNPKTRNVKSITYKQQYAPELSNVDYGDNSSSSFYVIEFNNKLFTYNPYEFIYNSSYGITELQRIDKSDFRTDRRPIVILPLTVVGRHGTDGKSGLEHFVQTMFDPRYLDKDFIINGLGTKRARIDLGLPCTEIVVSKDGKVAINIPKPSNSEGPNVIKYEYMDPEKAVNAMAHLGVTPEDLTKLHDDITEAVDHMASANFQPFTKLAYALTAVDPAMATSGELNSDAVLQQATVLLQNIQQTQAQMQADYEARERMIDTQLQLVDEKLDNIEQLQAVLAQAVDNTEIPAEEPAQPEEEAPVEPEQLPPEVIETMVSAALDPSTAEANDFSPEDIEMLQQAAQGDEEAAKEIGLVGPDYQLFLQLYHENIDQNNYADQAPAEEAPAAEPQGTQTVIDNGKAPQVSQDDIEQLAQVLLDPKGAKREIGADLVDNLLRAVMGDEDAAAAIGITVEIARKADELADQLSAEKAQAEQEEAEKQQKEDTINTLVQILTDPENSGVDQSMIDNLEKAVQGDEEAAIQIGISVADAQAAAFRAAQTQEEAQPDPEANADQAAPAEAAPAAEGQQAAPAPENQQAAASDEDINTLAEILKDQDNARQQLGDDMVDKLLAAVNGDEAAAQAIGITVADAQKAQELAGSAQQPEQQAQPAEGEAPAEGNAQPSEEAAPEANGGASDEDLQAIAQILADPEGAKQQYDPQVVDQVVAASNGDQNALSQLGLTEEDMQRAMEMAQQGGGAEQQQPQTPEEAQKSLDEQFDDATRLVEAYLDPTKIEEYGINAEDLGICTLVLRSPDAAIRAGIPGERVQAISDAYKMITGKSVYRSAEDEFEMGAGNLPVSTANMSATRSAIPRSKAFEEYAKPLSETSALLDMLPKVKTAKLFFKNADAFRNMLSTLGEILINLQINSVHYKESLGTDSFKKLLTRVRKMYEDFGTTLLEMYSLDKD